MQLSHDGDKFIFKCGFESRHIPKEAGFYWHTLTRAWATESISKAVRLRQYADDTANEILEKSFIQVKPWSGGLDYNKENTPFDFQIKAALFALSRNKSYLGLDPGLGKTIVATIVAGTIKQNVIYICPPFLVENTKNEFEKWLPKNWLDSYQIGIVPDSMVWRLRPGIATIIGKATINDTILIIDEAHRFKSETSQRTKAIQSLMRKYERVILMSGTPMPNRPMELYSALSVAAPETIDFKNKHEFGLMYCNAFHNGLGWDYSGASNMEMLAHRVKEKFLLRMKKEDVLKDLPEKRQEIVIISATLPPKVGRLEREMLKNYSPSKDNLPEGENASRYRKELGIFKAKFAAEFVRDILENSDESVLLFGYHKEAIRHLVQELIDFDPFLITGETPVDARQEMVKNFQESKTRRLFIGNYLACGVGFTLTKATRVVFSEFSWVPGENEQAQDRAHRIGQTEKVLVQYLVYKNSFDREVIETNLRKMKVISHLER